MSITMNERMTTIETAQSCQDRPPLQIAFLQATVKITRIECFRYDHELIAKLQLGDGVDTIYGLLAISTDTGAVGIKEFAIPSGSLKCDLTTWVALFQRIKGLTLTESMDYTQLKQAAWGPVRKELIESALQDLIEKTEPISLTNKDQKYILDRAYLYNYSQSYISF
ncbi:hypothetical protein HZF08_30480 [Paenibacillus sp. CGMCC 1.16610]|uniref:Uncharacterized protein n=1 Tax=Paenibacillus anseongense TaxID=2682845 RepID=A0ABW9U5W1_9BACL|nr:MULTISPECIES: hypothetical protein [Paenibacillus]MBA2942604.1 hypothetical protein [Paenibacillus sp. CGMCC 1.16610]MVQ35418.1 hypothetical protein [Paenibacillus anseongense]